MAKQYTFLAGGKWIGEGEREEIRNPFNTELIGTVPLADETHAEAAIAAAVRAFDVTRKLPAYKRTEILSKIVHAMIKRKDELARIIAMEAGKPLLFSKTEIDRSIFTFKQAAEEAGRIGGEVIPLDLMQSSENYFSITRRFPIGPILGISPFNFPSNLAVHKLAPAIASGNPMVLKPAPQSPLTALALAEIIMDAGWPEGALSVLPCSIPVAEKLVKDDRFKLLSFTGSPKVGWYLKNIAGKKKVILELGGNAAAIVHSDADIDFAVKRIIIGGFGYAGQTCISVQRILVQEDILDTFKSKLFDAAKSVKCGDTLADDTLVGPMIDEGAAQRIEAWVNEAVSGGAKVVTGAKRDGAFYEPTIVTDVTPGMKLHELEAFAPVVTLQPYKDFQEAVNEVNSSDFGLQAGVFTANIHNVWDAFTDIDTGGVVINDYPTYRIDHMPYGGIKDSGLGREGLKYAIEDMTEQKVLVLNFNR